MLLAIYRSLLPSQRARVDQALSCAWHDHSADQALTDENRRLCRAVDSLQAEHTSGDVVSYFASCWRAGVPGKGSDSVGGAR
jgi:hypothetical protein